MTLIRFVLVTCLAAGSISLLGRMVSDFDEPPANDPHNLSRGLGIWVIAILIAFLNERRIRRKKMPAA